MDIGKRVERTVTQHQTRLLVVGGRGFIGRHIVNHAVGLGWAVTSLNLLSQHAEEANLASVRHVAADIADGDALKEALSASSFEYVVNCGGYINHALFFNGGRRVLDAHWRGVLNLVEVLDRDVLQAFINIGSSDEYGNNPAPQIETQREAPISPYAAGKVAATHFLQMLHRTDGFPSTTLRLFLTYGPGQDDRRFLPQIIHGCLEGQSFPVSAGQQLRDFCFIQDVVEAVFAVFSRPAAMGEVINIASGVAVTIRDVIETVRSLVGRGIPQYGAIAYRPGENMKLYADISKAKEVLGWEPRITLGMGLEKTIRWVVDAI